MFCPYCGTESKIAEAKYCSKCGKALPQMENSVYQKPESFVKEPKEQQEQLAFDGVYDTNLPPGVYYGPLGYLNWLYKGTVTDKYDDAPIGTEYIIRYEFNEQEIVRYRRQYLNYKPKEKSKTEKAFYGTMDVLSDLVILFSDNDSLVDSAMIYSDLREEPSETAGKYVYKKIKIIQPNPEEQKISIKHGIDKFSLFVMPEQFEYILAEIEKRCPNAVRGEVFKKK